jgi:MoaA/NifB/PqqE/SkfB family radical SAM enzyme
VTLPQAGRSLTGYAAPLFLAWQLTNRCGCACLACCEESGPDKGWPDELTRDEALHIARQIVDAGIPYAAFGGGEPMGVPHFWDILEILAAGGLGIKLETNGSLIDAAAARRLAGLNVTCAQISVDGATAATHERVRPGGSFAGALAAMRHLVDAGIAPQFVFVPMRQNLAEMVPAYELARQAGCSAFVTGPLMRLGRAALSWHALAPDDAAWRDAVQTLRRHAADTTGGLDLAIYPWDIVRELQTRLVSPQAMLLVVPNGHVKLLNALPFSAGDLRRDSLADAWRNYRNAWASDTVRHFIERCVADPALLRHANEVWAVEMAAA